VAPVRALGSAWLGSGVAVSAIGVAQWVTGALVPAGSVGRVTGVYYSPNHLALYLERVWPIALSAIVSAHLSVRERRWAWGAGAVMGAALFLTYSRGAWILAVPAALAAVGWYARRRLRWWIAGGVAIVLVLVASYVLLGRQPSPPSAGDPIRVLAWQSTLDMIADRPWLGVGLDGFRTIYPRYIREDAWQEPLLYHPHNAWLDAAVRTGLPGVGLYAALVGLTLRAVLRWARIVATEERAVAIGCVAGTLAGLAHGLVDSGYFLSDLAWSLALVSALAPVSNSMSSRR
jgi:putative inorganic carbon (HCO3(-)) transporter